MAYGLERSSLSPFARAPVVQNPLYRLPLNWQTGIKGVGFGKGTCGRTSSGWYFDPETQLWVEAGVGEARIEPKGLLIEPASTNLCLRNRLIGTSPWWTDSVTTAQDEIGIDGVSNTATTITDNASDNAEYILQSMTVPNDSNPTVASIFVKKSKSPVDHVMGFQLTLTNGSAINAVSHFDNYSGKLVDLNAYPRDYGGVDSYGDWWRIWIGLDNNSSGNTTAVVYIYPARETVVTDQGSPTVTGSIIVDMVQVENNKTVPTSPIENADGDYPTPQTRATDAQVYSWPIPSPVSTMLADSGTLICVWTPHINQTDLSTGNQNIISTSSSPYSLLYADITFIYKCYEGTNTAVNYTTYERGRSYVVCINWGISSGTKFEVGVKAPGSDWDWGTETDFDGAFYDGGVLRLGYGMTALPFNIRNIHFYNLLTQTQVESMI